MGPLLFLIYVNDETESLLSLTRLFADDSSLSFSASNPRDIEGILNHDLAQWHAHIDNTCIVKSADKTVSIMRKLKYTFSRQAFNQVYISYVRPLLEYSSIVWDG